MIRQVATLVVALIYSLSISAYAVDKLTIRGIVYDKTSDTQLFVVDVKLLDAQDSTMIAHTKAVGEYEGQIKGEFERKSIFILSDIDRNNKYVLELTRDGYEPLYLTVDPATVSKRLDSMNLGKLTWAAFDKLYLTFNLPVVYRNQLLHYNRGTVDASISRNKVYIGNASLDISYYGRPHYVYFTYGRQVSSPDLIDMVEYRNELDPLNVRIGNPQLKDSELHNFSLSYRKDSKKYQSYRLYASVWRNALSYGYEYDSATGVKTGRMYNVNGNYMSGASQYFSFSFGKMQQFDFNNTTTLDYRRSVDLISENSSLPVKNRVDNVLFSENVEVSYKFAGNKVSLNADGKLSHFTSRQEHFKNFTARDFRYGIKGDFTLPVGFGLSTDFTVYTRSGYSDSSLNKTNFVWNARATYTILNGQLTFMIDGFDMLHNLSNVFYNVNAQARTETYTNVLPQYVMFHVQWKIHKAPKNK